MLSMVHTSVYEHSCISLEYQTHTVFIGLYIKKIATDKLRMAMNTKWTHWFCEIGQLQWTEMPPTL